MQASRRFSRNGSSLSITPRLPGYLRQSYSCCTTYAFLDIIERFIQPANNPTVPALNLGPPTPSTSILLSEPYATDASSDNYRSSPCFVSQMLSRSILCANLGGQVQKAAQLLLYILTSSQLCICILSLQPTSPSYLLTTPKGTNMLRLTVSLALLSTFAAATPVQPKARAQVISLGPRTNIHGTDKVFNATLAKKDRARVLWKYAKLGKVATAGANRTITARSVSGGDAPYDINLVRRASSGGVALTDDYDGIDELYYGSLSIGTPLQTTTVDFDTGSSDLVMPLSSCTSCYGPLFNTAKSSTYKVTSTPFSIQYEDGSGASGKVATDTVSIAGISVTNQGFGAVTSETNGFGNGPNAGLIGLGFTPNAESGKVPWFINAATSGLLTSKVFSFYMARNGGSGSELCIGCTDSAKYTGAVTYYALDSSATSGTQYYWNFPSTGFYYNNGASTGSFSAIIDSGTTLIYIPTAAAKALYAQIPGAKSASSTVGAGFYSYPCSSTLAPITLKFGSTQYAVNIQDFNLGAVSSGSAQCVGGIVGEDVGSGLAIIGDEFMKNWYSVFDYANSRVGFAKAI